MRQNCSHSLSQNNLLDDPSGFSLVELVVVLSIFATLLTIATLNFSTWQVKHNIEAQVKKMATDINEVRVRAMTRKQKHSVTIDSSSYVFKSYSSDDEPAASGTVIPGGNHVVSYMLKEDASTLFSNKTIEIDHRGMLVDPGDTIYVDRGENSSLNCISLHTIRTNVGKSNATWSNCDDK